MGPVPGTSESSEPAELVGALSAPDWVCAELRTGMAVMRMTMRINFAFMLLLLGLLVVPLRLSKMTLVMALELVRSKNENGLPESRKSDECSRDFAFAPNLFHVQPPRRHVRDPGSVIYHFNSRLPINWVDATVAGKHSPERRKSPTGAKLNAPKKKSKIDI
jgi:hypothetical protein